jgi:aldose 1-epimerase
METQFQIENIGEGTEFHQIILRNTNTKEYISVLPEIGARLNAAHLLSNGNLIPVLLELQRTEFNTNDEMFNSAKLFPFAGRIKNGTYSFNSQTYHLPINYKQEANACHGFMYQKKFDVVSYNICKDFVEIELSHQSIDGYEGYPFSFNIIVTHKLADTGEVTTTTTVENIGKNQLIFSDGWHPYYTLGNSVNNLSIEFNGKEKIELDKNNIPTGSRIKLDKDHKINIGDKNLDDVFCLLSKDSKNEINLSSKEANLVLNIWQDSGINKYDYLVLYTPPDRKSIAIEPLTSNIDSFNNKEDLIFLKPGNKWSASYGFWLNKT